MTQNLVEKIAEAGFNSHHEERWINEPDGLIKTMWRDCAKVQLSIIDTELLKDCQKALLQSQHFVENTYALTQIEKVLKKIKVVRGL